MNLILNDLFSFFASDLKTSVDEEVNKCQHQSNVDKGVREKASKKNGSF